MNGCQARSDGLVGLARNHPVPASPIRPISQFRPILSAFGLNEAIIQKSPALGTRKELCFIRQHTVIMTCLKLRELSSKVLMHPPYFPDLFQYIENALAGEGMTSRELCENRLRQRDKALCERSIMTLASKWRRVTEQKQFNKK